MWEANSREMRILWLAIWNRTSHWVPHYLEFWLLSLQIPWEPISSQPLRLSRIQWDKPVLLEGIVGLRLGDLRFSWRVHMRVTLLLMSPAIQAMGTSMTHWEDSCDPPSTRRVSWLLVEWTGFDLRSMMRNKFNNTLNHPWKRLFDLTQILKIRCDR